jgi:ankyrin repeat protein
MTSSRPRATIGRWAGAVVVAIALASGRGAAEDDMPILHELVAQGDEARLAKAIAAGAPIDEPDGEGRTPLHVAAAESRFFAAMLLVGRGADPNARDRERRTPLHLAADGAPRRDGERIQIVKLLLAKGADPTARDASGRQPVDYAKEPPFVEALTP